MNFRHNVLISNPHVRLAGFPKSRMQNCTILGLINRLTSKVFFYCLLKRYFSSQSHKQGHSLMGNEVFAEINVEILPSQGKIFRTRGSFLKELLEVKIFGRFKMLF